MTGAVFRETWGYCAGTGGLARTGRHEGTCLPASGRPVLRANALDGGTTVDLDVERSRPSGNADKDPGGGALFNLAIDGALRPRFSGTFGTG